LKKIKEILVIIQRSNGDVFFSYTLIKNLLKNYSLASVDLLVNNDTIQTASLFPEVRKIHSYSYAMKAKLGFKYDIFLAKKLWRKYDLSINLTSSDRSVFFAWSSGKNSISIVDESLSKSWWKKIILDWHIPYKPQIHSLSQTLSILDCLKISYRKNLFCPEINPRTLKKVKDLLKFQKVDRFIIFHPCAQYNYKIYPTENRNKLIDLLIKEKFSIVLTGGKNHIDSDISKSIKKNKKILNLIGKTSLEEFTALCSLSEAYVGMDTLNMHIASSLNKPIFAIFGPTNLKKWSPWSNQTNMSARTDVPFQKYGENRIFQADMPCVACGLAGCDDQHGKSECLYHISPEIIMRHYNEWLNQK